MSNKGKSLSLSQFSLKRITDSFSEYESMTCKNDYKKSCHWKKQTHISF